MDTAWILNGLALIVLSGWLLLDGYMSRFQMRLPPADWVSDPANSWYLTFSGYEAANEGLSMALSAPRQRFGLWLAASFLVSVLGIAAGFAAGRRRHRSLRAMLCLVVVASLWLTVLSNWGRVIELGRYWTVSRHSQALELFAEETLRDWEKITDPNISPDTERWAPFNAYPLMKPKMLFTLGEQAVPGTDLFLRSIEVTPGEAICLELSGSQLGNWIVWRPDGSHPSDFVGGLEAPFRVSQYHRLKKNLYVVRYRTD